MKKIGFAMAILALQYASSIHSAAQLCALCQAVVASPSSTLEYDVVSIKLAPESSGYRFSERPGELTVRSLTLKQLIQAAWGFTSGFTTGMEKYSFVQGGSKWTGIDRYDIDARYDDQVAERLQQMTPSERARARQRMLQQMLEDRFGIKVHPTTEIYSVYALEVAKGGPKMQAAKQGNSQDSVTGGSNLFQISNGSLDSDDIQMTTLVAALNSPLSGLQTLVVDRTGLQGHYRVNLKWDPFFSQEPSSDSGRGTNGPTLPMALDDQLGLKLTHTKLPMPALVLDAATHPSPN